MECVVKRCMLPDNSHLYKLQSLKSQAVNKMRSPSFTYTHTYMDSVARLSGPLNLPL